MGPNGPYSKLIYLVGMGPKGRLDSTFTSMHMGILVIMQGCIGVSGKALQIELID